MNNIKKLNTIALTLLITGSIDSIRNLPAAAMFGSSLIFFFILAAVVFLLPSALVSAELTANADEGGIYQWGRLAFGKRMGFLAVWLQWVNNIAWFPAILSFIAGTAAYLIDPQLAQNKYYLISVILGAFWLLTFINLKGLHVSTKFTSFCTVVGLIVPMLFIISLLVVWLGMRKPTQIILSSHHILPSFSNTDNWMALTAIILGFAGLELTSVHIKEVNNPQKAFPRALGISTLIILATMMLGSLAIACVIPLDHINLVNGTIQTFAYFLQAYHLQWLTPLITLMIVIGSLGGMLSWVSSPIKGLAQAAHDGFLPAVFERQNEHGAAQNLLLLQAVFVSVFCLAFLFLPSINASFWLLTSLTTQLYILMYVLMFVFAIRIRSKSEYVAHTFTIPGKKLGTYLVCALGLLGCTITLIVGFMPPTNINIGSPWQYELIYCGGLFGMILPVLFFYRIRTLALRRADGVGVALPVAAE